MQQLFAAARNPQPAFDVRDTSFVISVSITKLFYFICELLDPSNQVAQLLLHHRDNRDSQYELDDQTQPELFR